MGKAGQKSEKIVTSKARKSPEKPKTGPITNRVRRNIACKIKEKRNVTSKEISEVMDSVDIKMKEPLSPAEIDDLEGIAGTEEHILPAAVSSEVEADIASIFDDPAEIIKQQDAKELSDDYRYSIISARKARERRKKEEERYMFENVKIEDVPALAKRICTFHASNDKVDRLAYAVKKFISFANDAEKKLKLSTEFAKLPDSEKLKAIIQYNAANPIINIPKLGEMRSWSLIKEIIQICFPMLTFKRTKCNPAAFASILFEEALIPLYRIRETRTIWSWFSNRGDRFQKRMADKLTQIVTTRMKNELAVQKS